MSVMLHVWISSASLRTVIFVLMNFPFCSLNYMDSSFHIDLLCNLLLDIENLK